jgi:CHC2-type zinc finger protein
MYDPSRNPDARNLYESEGVNFVGRANSKEYILGDCKFHSSKSHRSCSYNLRNGSFVCFGCGTKGDMVRFIMLLHNLNFRRACEYLHAWVEDGKQTSPRRRERPKSIERQLAEAVVDGLPPNPERAQHLFVQTLERLHDGAANRAAEIRQCSMEKYPGEEDECLELQYLTAANLRLEGHK